MMNVPLGHLCPQNLRRRDLVTHELVIDVSADALLVDGKRLHG
jgi:hypothetical protein